MVLLLMTMNLRGVRESGAFFAIPTYLFMASIMAMCVWGLLQWMNGTLPNVDSAQYHIIPQHGYAEPLGTVALVVLITRAFSSGSAALTGVEAISNGVPAFRRPKSKNAATTLLLLGTIAITMMMGVIALANLMHLRFVDPRGYDRLRTASGAPVPPDYDQHTVISQIAKGVFDSFPPGFYFVVAFTGLILILAANTAFNGFPVLGSILARDGFLPRALGSRGDRLAYSNGIAILAVMAIVLIIAFNAETTRLIQLYIVGVFVSFNLSQLGMIRHWTRHLKTETDPAQRRHMMRSRAINTFGLVMTSFVFVIVLLTKFLAGAWISILAMCVFFVLMRGIRRHYDSVELELAADEEDRVLPTKVHAIVLVSKLHKPTLRALAYAKASRPNVLEAVYVSVDDKTNQELLREWEERNLGVPLKVLYSPYREIVKPIADYASADPQDQPARRRRGLHPGVRRGALVGAAPAQPDGAAAQGPAAVHARGDGHLGALPAALLPDRAGAGGAGPRAGQGGRPPPRHRRHQPPGARAAQPSAQVTGSRPSRPARRQRRERAPRGASHVGERFEVEVGPVAHGGHCVARHDEPRGLRAARAAGGAGRGRGHRGPRGDRFCGATPCRCSWPRADRVEPPCPYAGPGRCGGCDFQHVDLCRASGPSRRPWSASSCPGSPGSTSPVTVEEVPATSTAAVAHPHALRRATGGARGLHVHRSHEVVEIDDCLARTPVARAGCGSRWTTTSGSHDFVVGPDGFWQSHVEAPRVLVDAVLSLLLPQPGERVLDLYAGVGLFAAFLADAVGPRGGWSPSRATAGRRDARRQPADRGPGRAGGRSTACWPASYDEPFDLVVLDPPREGAQRTVVEQVADRAPRAVAYVACDPAALARDLAIFAERGYRLRGCGRSTCSR